MLWYSACCYATPHSPRGAECSVVRIDKNFEEADLSAYCFIYTDSACTNFFNRPARKIAELDQKALLKMRSTGYIKFYIQLCIENVSGVSVKLFLYSDVRPWLRVWDAQNTGLQIGEAGFFSYANSGFTPEYGVPLLLAANEKRLFLVETADLYKLQSALRPLLFSAEKYAAMVLDKEKEKKPAFVIQLLLLGGIFVLSVFMLAQFLVHKDRSYLFYALYGFFLFLYIERSIEMNNNARIISQLVPTYFHTSVGYYTLLVGICYNLFITSFINISRQTIRWWIINGLLWIQMISLLISLLINIFSLRLFFAIPFGMWVTFLPFIAIIIINVFLLPLWNRQKQSRYIIIGSLFIIAGGLLQVYFNNYADNFVSFKFAPVTYLEMGALGELFFFALGLGYKRKMLEKEKKDVELKKMLSELQMLRSQMNPHFIFNCLNSIELYTAQNNAEAAGHYLSRFSRLVRMVLDNSKNEWITLNSEFEMLRLYLELEQMRFKNKLKYKINIDGDVDEHYIEIPPMLIQPFVENAIWHGLMHKLEGGRITIEAVTHNNQLSVKITDNGIGRAKASELKRNAAVKNKSYGMDITQQRVDIVNTLYHANVTVAIKDLFSGDEPAGTEVILLMPLN